VRVLLPVVLIAAAAAAVASGAARAGGTFRTPSGNIVCGYIRGTRTIPATLECGIKSGLSPKPPRSAPACKHLDYVANRIALTSGGRATPIPCAGDPGPLAFAGTAPILAYGRSWRRGGFRCTSRVTGLTCRNRRGHGFFLSRERWRRV
jgi:hypothetical protein